MTFDLLGFWYCQVVKIGKVGWYIFYLIANDFECSGMIKLQKFFLICYILTSHSGSKSSTSLTLEVVVDN